VASASSKNESRRASASSQSEIHISVFFFSTSIYQGTAPAEDKRRRNGQEERLGSKHELGIRAGDDRPENYKVTEPHPRGKLGAGETMRNQKKKLN